VQLGLTSVKFFINGMMQGNNIMVEFNAWNIAVHAVVGKMSSHTIS
jgi:hypothetical protein